MQTFRITTKQLNGISYISYIQSFANFRQVYFDIIGNMESGFYVKYIEVLFGEFGWIELDLNNFELVEGWVHVSPALG